MHKRRGPPLPITFGDRLRPGAAPPPRTLVPYQAGNREARGTHERREQGRKARLAGTAIVMQFMIPAPGRE